LFADSQFFVADDGRCCGIVGWQAEVKDRTKISDFQQVSVSQIGVTDGLSIDTECWSRGEESDTGGASVEFDGRVQGGHTGFTESEITGSAAADQAVSGGQRSKWKSATIIGQFQAGHRVWWQESAEVSHCRLAFRTIREKHGDLQATVFALSSLSLSAECKIGVVQHIPETPLKIRVGIGIGVPASGRGSRFCRMGLCWTDQGQRPQVCR
jgi:hypothetical protein